ncbi:bifunctional transcriptional activator/DNA repair enzyme AdaA [Listeria monocytogenes]|uniref:bifunctional transcriptional activator/DNA repair enzyme AdaA n=1 Tax=Listeria monocytogenes TaxID=1639 RepID=UPI00098E0F91|nr:bifunctional transcriptional activator/DNA repair enzyme AdaA [Listeria monocytogenes]EAD7746609.1 methylphosphotriester-DNA--protein-cysteine methyltransferase family protein [Listeria monocytogenes]EAO7456162.1 methylphosphotriester-DNA--protein-cysteine methyltransferase family protein [Listeria monocytogenes]EBF5102336.1 methylphosphotriester-DNA--protein-cysteine methyltransferase family protein [Listeria monocytogenes]EBF5103437.1 methylphosphotriester-DNA--protein-cysteine methyltrans
MSDYYLTKKRWQAISTNDKTADGAFFYGVTSTKIFCYPSCKSRLPKKENIVIFHSAEEAFSHGYRACKRCESGGSALPDTEWVNNIEMYIKENFAKALTLKIIADDCHGSPYHLHRTFKRITMITPITYLENVRINYAKMQLTTTNQSIETIGKMAGFPNPSHFSTTFKRHTGLSPNQFRKTIIKKLN